MSVRNKNTAISFIFMTVLIDVIGLGIIFPIIPKLISQFTDDDISTAAIYGGGLIFAYAFMQFIFAPILGNLSDKYGRRPILLISLSTLGLNCLFMAFAPNITWLFIGRIIGGITGSCYSVAMAYVADISTPKERPKNFGLLNAAFGIGFIIGPVIGGVMARWGTHIPFLFAMVLSILNVIYGYFVLPESLDQSKRRKFEWNRANPIGSFLQLKKYPVITGLLTAFTFIYIAGHSMESVWAYYTIERYEWKVETIGYSLGLLGLMMAIVQGVLVRFINPKIGNKQAIYWGLIIQCITFILIAFASEGWMIFALIIPYALSGIATPSLQTITTDQVPESGQGELQGGITSLISLTVIISPPIMSGLFSLFSNKDAPFIFPGMPFIFSALLILIGLFLTIRTFDKNKSNFKNF